jgi:hypothetical protein
VLVQPGETLVTDVHAAEIVNKIFSTNDAADEEAAAEAEGDSSRDGKAPVVGVLGRRADFDLLLKKKHAVSTDAAAPRLKWVALFEDGVEAPVQKDYLEKVAAALRADDVFVFRGTMEAAYMLSYRSLHQGDLGMVPHASLKVVGDRGTTDAKILAANTRGNLKLKGPHVTPLFFNNAGLQTELVDDRGFCSTSREAVVSEAKQWTIEATQMY